MPTLHLQVSAGFANRIRAMVSGVCAAEMLNVDLVVHWIPIAPECVCSFEMVLDPMSLPNRVKVVPTPLMNPKEVLSRQDWDSLLKHWDTKSDLCIKSHGIFLSNEKWTKYLQTLSPSRAVQEILKKSSPAEWSSAVGVHIRRTDNRKSIEGSPMEWFLERMRLISDKTFVVATDDEQVRIQLQKEFGPRCVFPASVLSRTSEEGMMHGVADFFALSLCSRILGSVGSSFSEIAARYGNSVLERA